MQRGDALFGCMVEVNRPQPVVFAVPGHEQRPKMVCFMRVD